MDSAGIARPTVVRKRASMLQHLRELTGYGDLIVNLVVRDLKARYKGSVLGFLWTLLNPLAMMVVFTVVFTVVLPNYSVPRFPIFFLAGLLPWNFFTAGVMVSITSVVGNANLVKKVYFPREVLPISSVLANLVNFLLSLVVLFVVLLVLRSPISPYLWLLPVVIIIQTCFVIGLALILSTANVFYRDTMMIMDVVMLAWFFLTPVIYPYTMIPTSYQVMGITIDPRRIVFILNPMASLITAYRDILYWGYRTNLDFFLRTAVTSLAVLAVGYWLFIRYSHRFGEEV